MGRTNVMVAMLLGAVLAVGGAGTRAAAEEESPIVAAMEVINKSVKQLKPLLADASKNEQSLALVTEIQKQAVIAKGLVPKKAATLSGAEKAKFVAEYRKSLAAFLGDVLKLETALLDGKNDEAMKVWETFTKTKNAGHEKFMDE